MSINDWRAIAYELRAIPGQLGLRPYTVAVVEGSWSGAYPGRGARVDVETFITEAGGQPPKVESVNDEELALGNLDAGTVRIGPITPDFTGGGTPLTRIVPAVANGETVHLKLTGPAYPTGALFRITSVETASALHWTITASPVANA